MPSLGLWRPEENFSKAHAFRHVGPRDQTQAPGLGSQSSAVSLRGLVGSNINLFFKLKRAKLKPRHITGLEGCEGKV